MPRAAAAPFVGRQQELVVVRAVLERARAGSGSAVVVEGPGGIGKSRLVTEAIALVDGLTAFHVSCGELERDVPFAAIATALDLRRSSTDPQAAALATLIGNAGSEDIRFRVVDEIIDLLERRALHRPVAVVLDDVHRADPGSLLVAKRLARAASVLPIALVCTRRPFPARPEVDEALADASVVELGALSAEELSNLAAGVLGASPGASLTSAIERSGGNPLYANELVRSLDADHRIDRVEGTANLIGGELPRSLRLTILAQLSFLDNDAVLVLRVASCFGTSFDSRDLSIVLGRSAADLQRVLEPAIRAALLVDTGERLSFRHDLVREAIYDDMPEAIRVGMHGDIAAALTAADRPVTELAPHVLRSARAGDAASVDVLRRAAEATLPLSATTAVELLTHANGVAPATYPARHDLALDLAAALSIAGRQPEAESLARGVLAEQPTPPIAQRARAAVLVALREQDRVRDGVDILEALAAAFPQDARTLGLAARGWSQLGETEPARALANEALRLGAEVGDVEAQCLAVLALGWADIFDGRVGQVPVHLARVMDLMGTGEVDPATRADVVWGYLRVLGAFAPFREQARQQVGEEVRRAEAAGHLAVLSRLNATLAWDHLHWAEFDDAVLTANAAVRAAEDGGGARFLCSAYCSLAVAAIHLGDLAAPQALFALAEAHNADTDDPLVGAFELLVGNAYYESARGRPGAAADLLLGGFAEYRASPDRSADILLLSLALHLPALARWLLEADRLDEARQIPDLLVDLTTSSDLFADIGTVLDIVSLQVGALLDGDAAAARAMVERQRPLYVGLRLLEGMEDAAGILERAGERDDAVAMFQEALAGYERAGAAFDCARLTARLRELGVRRGVTGARGRPTTGWDALTEAELRVADLVADGLTYREIGERLFLSRRTVESHVARIFNKLDLSSRRDLGRAVLDRRA